MFRRVLLFWLLLGASVDAARILAAFTTASISHQIVFLPIVKELASRGHEVVVITTDPIKENVPPTLRQIDISFTYDPLKTEYNLTKLIAETKHNPIKLLRSIVSVINDANSRILDHPEVQQLLHSDTEKFDLFLVEFLLPSLMGFKHKFKCPMIGVTSRDSPYDAHKAVGNPTHPILYPDVTLKLNEKLTFTERLISFLFVKFYHLNTYFMTIPLIEKTKEKYFGKDYPHTMDLMKSVDMIFINTNHAFHYNRPMTPAAITIGPFIHIKPAKPLPKDLQVFLDEAKEGVIYFSLGSNAKSKDFSLQTREIILRAFGDLPYKVLWKFEADDLVGIPNNVKIMKWVPQQDVLRHTNIKLFITQCGLQSLEEGLFNKIPFVGIPVFGDQKANAMKMELRGLGVQLDYDNLQYDQFKSAVLEVINNPKYKERVTELSNLIKDEPMTGLEKAVFWSEYVIRNKGAQHLKGPEADIPVYQFYYLDIFAFLGLLFFLFSTLIYYILKYGFISGKRLMIKSKKD